jgi:KaiC/GvpD/RAD55 family RecA-like ATPase
MFTDMVGYAALTQRNEALALRLLEKHRELVRPLFKKHGGREVKTIGDAFMIEFGSALAATECAVDVQRILHNYNEGAAEKLPLKIGIHVGDVVHRGGDVYGDAVNIASRIEPLAQGGEICISQQVYDQVRNKVPFRFVRLEPHELKNISSRVDVYRLELAWEKVEAKRVDHVPSRKGLPQSLFLPILAKLIPSGLTFGANYLVEFEPGSLWYETSLTLAAQALGQGTKTEYHTFQHIPQEVLEALAKLGLDVEPLEEKDLLRIMDSYTRMTGIGVFEKRGKQWEKIRKFYEPWEGSLDLRDWDLAAIQEYGEGVTVIGKHWIHVDDNTSVLLQYNSEKAFIDFWRTRIIPGARVEEGALMHSVIAGVYSEGFYRQFEALCDGTIDFRSHEVGGEIEQYMRVRAMRGKTYDSHWHRLRLHENGEVTVGPSAAKEFE